MSRKSNQLLEIYVPGMSLQWLHWYRQEVQKLEVQMLSQTFHSVLPTWCLVPLSYVPCKCHVCSTSRVSHCLHQPLPCWFTKLLHIVVPLQPLCYHWCEASSRVVVVNLNAIQGIRVQPQGNTDVLPVCREWSQLTLHIEKIITGVWSKQKNVLPCGYLIGEHVVCKQLCELLEKRFNLDRVAERGLSVYM